MPENPDFGRFPPEVVSVAKAMANTSRMEILAHLEAAGPARFTDLGTLTGLQSGALSPHLKKLQRGGIIQKVAYEQDEEVLERYQLSPFGRRILDQVHRAFVPPTHWATDRYSLSSGSKEIAGDVVVLDDETGYSLAGDTVELEA